MINKVFLLGNLGKEPEISYLESGMAITNFSLATSEKRNETTQTEWHRIVAFGKMAEICAKHLGKGTKVFVEGRIRYESWHDKDGQKKTSTKIILSSMRIISGGVWEGNKQREPGMEDIPPDQGDGNVPF